MIRPIRSLDQLKRSTKAHERELAEALVLLHNDAADAADDHWIGLVEMLLRCKDVMAVPSGVRAARAEDAAAVGFMAKIDMSMECVVCAGFPAAVRAVVLDFLHD